jgi:hypothetical protein
MLGAGGARGAGVGGQENIPIQSPQLFSKFVSIYDHLFHLVVLHDLPEKLHEKPP